MENQENRCSTDFNVTPEKKDINKINRLNVRNTIDLQEIKEQFSPIMNKRNNLNNTDIVQKGEDFEFNQFPMMSLPITKRPVRERN